MKLIKADDLLSLQRGETVTKRNLFDLIQFSKVEGSPYWQGSHSRIGNTPQQGINWIGDPPRVRAVIIKTKQGAYEEDGWKGIEHNEYSYSFKAARGVISYTEKANAVLINQPQFLYPVLHFTECSEGWRFEGEFQVTEIADKHVTLRRDRTALTSSVDLQAESQYIEGGRKYVTHLMAERNKAVTDEVKRNTVSVCDICNQEFKDIYGVDYIEAHHKVPISTYTGVHRIKPSDFVLLCPNCHKAVHIFMNKQGVDYDQIRRELQKKMKLRSH